MVGDVGDVVMLDGMDVCVVMLCVRVLCVSLFCCVLEKDSAGVLSGDSKRRDISIASRCCPACIRRRIARTVGSKDQKGAAQPKSWIRNEERRFVVQKPNQQQ